MLTGWVARGVVLGAAVTLSGTLLPHVDEAVRACDEALEIRKQTDVGARALAIAELTLANALWARPRERTRAHALAKKAEYTLLADPDAKNDAKQATTWLSEHAAPKG